MGFVQVREGAKGTRYTAMYRDGSGRRVAAGTYDTKEQAQQVADKTELQVRTGASGTTASHKATVILSDYVEDFFLRNHSAAPVTMRNYQGILTNHVLPHLGKHRVAELDIETVGAWLKTLDKAGMSPTMLRRCRVTLSAVMTMAVIGGYRTSHPARGLKTGRIGKKHILVLTKDQFKEVHCHLPTDGAKAMALLVVNSGLRFGETTALLVRDIDYETNMLYVTKAVSDVGAAWHPNGTDRFIVNPYPKDGDNRQMDLPPAVARYLKGYVRKYSLRPDDLLFPLSLVRHDTANTFPATKGRVPLTPERLAQLGTFTGPNGRDYDHGSVNGYVTGKCKCDACRQAISEYSAARRTARTVRKRRDTPAAPAINRSGHLPRESWGRMWAAAVRQAEIPFKPTAYQLRHTHASWLIAAGHTPQEVRERLGHDSLSMTGRYITRTGEPTAATTAMDDLLADMDLMADLDMDDLLT